MSHRVLHGKTTIINNTDMRMSIATRWVLGVFAVVLCVMASGCNRTSPDQFQGYVEGEYVYVSSPRAGTLQTLNVSRGQQVNGNDALFTLDPEPEQSIRDEAQRRVTQARATLDDMKKGLRPSEIESIQAQLDQAQITLAFAEKEYVRLQAANESSAATNHELDLARTERDRSQQRVAQLEADIQTARLGSRTDQIAAAEANVLALESVLAAAEWDLAQKMQTAPQGGVVFDTMYRVGEWVAAGRPVVSILPPANIKVRAFIPQSRIGTVNLGDGVSVHVDGVASPFTGKVSFISPEVEYTPPVIFSRESRSKLVFMIEAVFEPDVAAKLHPGQPIDLRFAP